MRPPRRPRLTEPQYFDYDVDTKRWKCGICSSQSIDMTANAAVKHEQTAEHKEHVRSCEEWSPGFEVDEWINPADPQIDLLRVYIPFWRKTIEAARYGKTLRFEDFFNGITKKTEPPKADQDSEGPGWPTVPTDPPGVDRRSHTRCSNSVPKQDDEGFDFVEKIVWMSSVDTERRKRLHSFYNVPTKDKLQRINELIDALRNMGQRAS